MPTMEKETNCLYKKLCMSVYPEQKMNEHRLNCSKDNSYWCPYYCAHIIGFCMTGTSTQKYLQYSPIPRMTRFEMKTNKKKQV